MSASSNQIHDQLVELAKQLNRLKKTVLEGKFEITQELFTLTLVRGGFLELVKANGGKTMRFTIQSGHATVVLQEFHIPDLGDENNLRGFLLSANDGVETLAIGKFEPEIGIDDAMQEFLEGLRTVVVNAFKNGNDIHVQLVKTRSI